MSIAPPLAALALAIVVLYLIVRLVRGSPGRCALLRAWRLQNTGEPRRARALLRRMRRSAEAALRPRYALCEANALLWEGRFERAIARLHEDVVPAKALATSAVPTILELECLVFDERIAEASALFEANAERLRKARDGAEDVVAILGFLAFHAGNLDAARGHVEKVARRRRKANPIRWAARYYLAAIAHRQGDAATARRLLAELAVDAGRTFIARWARLQHAELFPEAPLPAPARAPVPRRSRRRWALVTAGLAMWAASLYAANRAPYWTAAAAAAVRSHHVDKEAVRRWEQQRHADDEQRNERAIANAEHLVAAEAALAVERPGVTDLYFVGAAGYAGQDVFLNEVRGAQAVLERRFDTAGRSILLANDPGTRDELPLASNTTLRHTLKTVGQRMNRDEDVLVLLVTSHGSTEGLSLEFPAASAFEDEVLRPADLRGMLDDAGIQWRVLVIAGCETGVFVGPLANDRTLVAAAAASDRVSYGCTDGNAFTEFGRVLFDEQLASQSSLTTAFAETARVVGERETAKKLVPSRPQVSEGPEIGPKLREIEQRLALAATPGR